MKSLKLLVLTLGLCCAGLAGCRGGGYGAETEAAAIKKVVGGNLATVNNVTPLIAGQVSELDADNNDNVTVISKQTVNIDGQKVDVTVDWTYENTGNVVDLFHDLEGVDTNKVFEFNYPEKGAEAASFEFTATPKCGNTTGDPVKFNVSLTALKYVYPEYALGEILKVKDDGSCFEHVTNAEKGYWESNNKDAGTDYMYITTRGKVVYLSPDGNWGLIADGSLYCEIYAGSGRQLMNKYYPGLQVGNWVSVRGEPSNYKGNVQLGYISRVKQIEKGSMQEPGAMKTLDEAYINSYNQFNGDMNALFQVTGTYAGNASPAIANWTDGARATFDITVGSKTLTIAYDYHTSKGGSSTLFAEMHSVLSSATAGSTQLTIKGTLRFVASGSSIFTNAGTCQITPFLAGDVVAA